MDRRRRRSVIGRISGCRSGRLVGGGTLHRMADRRGDAAVSMAGDRASAGAGYHPREPLTLRRLAPRLGSGPAALLVGAWLRPAPLSVQPAGRCRSGCRRQRCRTVCFWQPV